MTVTSKNLACFRSFNQNELFETSSRLSTENFQAGIFFKNSMLEIEIFAKNFVISVLEMSFFHIICLTFQKTHSGQKYGKRAKFFDVTVIYVPIGNWPSTSAKPFASWINAPKLGSSSLVECDPYARRDQIMLRVSF